MTTLVVVVALTPLGDTADAASRTFTDISATRDGQGYALVSNAGEVYAFGAVQYRGNPVGFTGKIVGISVTGDGLGYVAVSSAGQVYAYGTAVYRGNPTGFSGSIVDISLTADGLGYVAISSRGQVYAYGTAVYRGNPAGFGGDIASVSITPDGQGYVAISTHGQVYAYNVVYRGNPTGFTGVMKSISVTAGGQGYIAMSSIGQMYAYNVVYRGNPTGHTGGMVGVSVTTNGQGYGAVSGIGQVYAYGTVVYRGNGDPGKTEYMDVQPGVVGKGGPKVDTQNWDGSTVRPCARASGPESIVTYTCRDGWVTGPFVINNPESSTWVGAGAISGGESFVDVKNGRVYEGCIWHYGPGYSYDVCEVVVVNKPRTLQLKQGGNRYYLIAVERWAFDLATAASCVEAMYHPTEYSIPENCT